MSKAKPFLLDTNIFIQAKNAYYAFAICPGFWQSLLVHHKKQRVFSIDFVRQELVVGRDELRDWVQSTVPDSFFLDTRDTEVMAYYHEVMAWVQGNSQFLDYAKAAFATGADGWLIAYAKAKGYTVVTHEEIAPAAKNRVPMPNVCHEFGVEYKDTFHMLKTLNVQFHLKAR